MTKQARYLYVTNRTELSEKLCGDTGKGMLKVKQGEKVGNEEVIEIRKIIRIIQNKKNIMVGYILRLAELIALVIKFKVNGAR